MWSRLYRDHVLMAFPTYDSANQAWVPQVDINWFIGSSHDSTFVRFPSRFLTENEAAACALTRGQAWIDKRLERQQACAVGLHPVAASIEPLGKNVSKGMVKRSRARHTASKRNGKPNLTFEEFAGLVAQKGMTLNVKTLQKSYTALVKIKKIKGWSWAETKRKVMRAHHAPAGTSRGIPLSERAWGKVV